jgi:hypothetical protein
MIRSDGDCSNPVFIIYDDKPVCKYHFFSIKAREDCSICLTSMAGCGSSRMGLTRVMLPCAHFFHKECLAKWGKVECPMCRDKIPGADAAGIFGVRDFGPIMETVYDMPMERIGTTLDIIRKVVGICERGDFYAEQVADIMVNMELACQLLEEAKEEPRGQPTAVAAAHREYDSRATVDAIIDGVMRFGLTGVGVSEIGEEEAAGAAAM